VDISHRRLLFVAVHTLLRIVEEVRVFLVVGEIFDHILWRELDHFFGLQLDAVALFLAQVEGTRFGSSQINCLSYFR
jgi:hypothetical protein